MDKCTCTTGAGGLTDPSCPIHGIGNQVDDIDKESRVASEIADVIMTIVRREYGDENKEL